jgi:hypothetical protein
MKDRDEVTKAVVQDRLEVIDSQRVQLEVAGIENNLSEERLAAQYQELMDRETRLREHYGHLLEDEEDGTPGESS